MTAPSPDRDQTALGPGEATDARVQRRAAGRDDEKLHQFVIEAARLLHDRHCEDVVAFDVRGLSDVTDYILIASGTSDRQIGAIADELEDTALEHDQERFGRQADEPTTWLVLDFVNLVVHLFDPDTRCHYDLEMMWGDAPRVDWG